LEWDASITHEWIRRLLQTGGARFRKIAKKKERAEGYGQFLERQNALYYRGKPGHR
jgi:hypothetical protein